MSYKLTVGGVIRNSDLAFIPENTGNIDWRAYQEWLAEGNTPDDTIKTEVEAENDRFLRRRLATVLAIRAIKQAAENPPTNIAGLRTLILNIAKAVDILDED